MPNPNCTTAKRGDLWVLGFGNADGSCDSFQDAPMGPFKSIRAARRAILADAGVDLDGLEVGRNPDWGSRYAIVRLEQIVRPVPVVAVKVQLQSVC